jgi:hypothetical protein
VVAGVVVAGVVVAGVVVAAVPGTVVLAADGDVVTVVLDPESWLGRTNHTRMPVATTIATATATAVHTSRRSRGAL